MRKRYPRAARVSRRSLGLPTLLSSGQLGGGITIPTVAGTSINSNTALSIAAVWNAVLIYANTIASLDFHVARRTGRNGAGRKAEPDHWAYDLVALEPNRIQTSFRFRQTIIGHAVTRGNGYAEIIRAGGRVVALHLMEPTQVTPALDDSGALVYHVFGAEKPLRSNDVLHVAGFGFDGVSGYCPITLAAEVLGLAKAEQTWQSGLFGNNATPNGHFEIAGNLDKEAKAEFRREVNLMHGGPARAGKFGILSGGAKWVQTSFSPSDAQLILGRQFSIAEVARIFNLPQHLLGQLDKATFSNIEEQNIQFYQISLMPWLVMLEQEWTRKILAPAERREFACWFDPATLLRGNLKARTEHAVAMNKMGAASINDVADDFGYPRIKTPSADKHWVAVNNMAAIEDMDAGLIPRPGSTPPAAPTKPDPSEEPQAAPDARVAKPRAKRRSKPPAAPPIAPEALQGPSPDAREGLNPLWRLTLRELTGKGGGCGTGHGGFKPGNKCGKRGSKSSIGDPAGRSPLDAARDTFSTAKLDHAAARAAHKAGPTDATAAKLATTGAALGSAREGYRGAHPSGQIEARPLDGNDPRVRALRHDRSSSPTTYGDQLGAGAGAAGRTAREDRALMRVPSHLAVEDHHGQPAPSFQQADKQALGRVKAADRKGARVDRADEPVEARMHDKAASDASVGVKGVHTLSFDRVSGTYGSHMSDYDIAMSANKWKGVASGRIQLVKAYQDGKQVPITEKIRTRFARPYDDARSRKALASKVYE